ncbi:MAG TPA: bifunctional precorrin-2 dehydrogenase/sirohydrochlorin ferrochelatase [Acidimicrobiales bacterium]|nr:bifunctional precorrin-2 dehydrogenase/sirohydrochlorin ferrochelatase [Acidimicrobiales bacterium]
MTSYPVNLVVEAKPVLVVGGGRVAVGKVRRLVESGARVTVVAPEVSDEIASMAGVTVERRPYAEGEVAAYRLAITATGTPVDAQVFAEGEAAGVWVNSADDPAHCSFTLPAVARRGPISVAVSTDGTSPAMASWLRARFEEELGPEYEVLLGILREQREALRSNGTPTEGLAWREALDSGLLDLVRQGRIVEARERLQACL